MERIPVYFMPGMAASPSIFDHIKLDQKLYQSFYLEWIKPTHHEPIEQYAGRISELITCKNPVLIGVSFGAMIVQELSKLITYRKLIIISSAKSHHEFPRRMKFARWTRMHKLLPTGLIRYAEIFAKYNFGIAHRKMKLYYTYLAVNDKKYLDWALNAIIDWKQDQPINGVIHIHGDQDPVFPLKYIQSPLVVKNGTHIMIINRYRWFNENLPRLINS
ncbi:MAG: alpha/beta hydrolase [Nonlabens sp.]